MYNILPTILVFIGAVIMFINIVNYFFLSRQLSLLKFKGKKYSKIMLLSYIFLLIFFLIGYIIVGFCLWNPEITVNSIVIGLILLFGSIFVLLVIKLQTNMSQTIQQTNLAMTKTLIAAIEARDTNLNGHSIHVSRLVKLIYSHLPKEERYKINEQDLEYAALLHDIGKLGVSESILNNKEPLTDEEWIIIKSHPQIGKNILSALDGFEEISYWVLYHHERCDGNGYLKLPYDKIPFPSRVIAVADTFSAITMKRSYRDAKSFNEAVTILKEVSGSQLDKYIVDLFLNIPKNEIDECFSDSLINQ